MPDSCWTLHFLLPYLFLNAVLGCPAGRTLQGSSKVFQNSQQKKQNKQHAQRKKPKQYQVIPPFLIVQKKKTPLLHSSKGGSAFAIHWVVEEKQCSDHKTHKSLCTQQFAHFNVLQILSAFPLKSCIILSCPTLRFLSSLQASSQQKYLGVNMSISECS